MLAIRMDCLIINREWSLSSHQGLWTRGLAQPVDAFDIDDLDVYDLILVSQFTRAVTI